MRILVIGDGHSKIHEVAVSKAFMDIGHNVRTIYWHSLFDDPRMIVRFIKRIQNKFLIGPIITKINHDIIRFAVDFNPDLIFIYRGTHVFSGTIRKLKSLIPHCKIFGYNNDDPFSKKHPYLLWRHFLRSIKYYDLMFAYRKHNIIDYLNCGAASSEILMPWFIEGKDEPLDLPLKNEVIFIGHYENDARIKYLKLLSSSPYDFKLFGPDWKRAPKLPFLKKFQPIVPLVGDRYREELCSSKIALCFLSSLNRDDYTRRCFEIPAMKVFMLCQYSTELARIYREDIDVVFFRSPKEMIEKIDFYLKNPDLRLKIAKNGYERVKDGGHDIVSRVRYVCSFVN